MVASNPSTCAACRCSAPLIRCCRRAIKDPTAAAIAGTDGHHLTVKKTQHLACKARNLRKQHHLSFARKAHCVSCPVCRCGTCLPWPLSGSRPSSSWTK
jgi:hypothetical protein